MKDFVQNTTENTEHVMWSIKAETEALETALEVLRVHRNTCCGHTHKFQMSANEFEAAVGHIWAACVAAVNLMAAVDKAAAGGSGGGGGS